jgi:hypothetical protein
MATASITGDVDLQGAVLPNVTAPVAGGDAATKLYVDQLSSQQTTVPITFTGPWAAPQVVNVTFDLLYDRACMILPEHIVIATNNSVISAAAGSVPAEFRPAIALTTFIPTYPGNQALNEGALIIGIDGSLQITADNIGTATFSAGFDAGWYEATLVYTTL